MASSPATSPPSPPGNDSVTPPPTSTTNSSSNSTSSSSPPPSASPPPSPPLSPPPSTPPPTESPPSPPPASSPPPRHDSSPPPPPSPTTHSPPPNSSSSSPPPSNSPTLSPPPPPSSTPSPSPPSPPATAPSTTTPTPPVPGSSSSPPPPPRSPSNTLSPPPPPPPLSPSTPSSSNSGSSPSKSSPSSSSSSDVAIIAGAAVAGVVVLAFIIVCLTCTRKKKKHSYYMETPRGPKGGDYYNPSWHGPRDHIVKFPSPPGASGPGSWGPPPPVGMSGEYSSPFSGPHHPSLPPPSPTMALGFSKSQFTYDELAAATGGFSEVNLLGQGGFGYVHKGVLPDGKEVAVKSLKSGSGQGEREFQAEVEIISRVHHRHLVSLVGYCIAGGQRMLVYEFVDNKTLEFHLHGKDQPVMDWATRLRIAVGSAKGLAYLHEDCHPRIIHRDIKAANILLDFNYEAMVADFGLAKLSSDNYTHVSTRVMGTFGYLAPEYASSGKLSEKSDVFSFGVMLLELITGRKPVDFTNKLMEDSLVDWARPLLTKATEDGDYDELVDPRLEGNYARQELTRMAACAAASIRHSARRRPRMSQIVRALDGDASLDDLNEAPKPSPSPSSANISSMNTSAYDTGAYNADMMKFRKMVLSSQDEFGGSSEYERTGEFGLRASPSSNDSRDMGHSGVQRQRL